MRKTNLKTIIKTLEEIQGLTCNGWVLWRADPEGSVTFETTCQTRDLIEIVKKSSDLFYRVANIKAVISKETVKKFFEEKEAFSEYPCEFFKVYIEFK